jgi:hypothetical protein
VGGGTRRDHPEEGLPLTATTLADAKRIGVLHPEKVRLRVTPEIPMPSHLVLQKAAEATGLLSPFTVGLTLRYGIYIHEDGWGDRLLVAHELAHTLQYERLGGFSQFLAAYLHECITPPGYPHGPLEREADRISNEICGSSGK